MIAKNIINFWLGDSVYGPEAAAARHKLWYRGGDTLDVEIRTRFGQCVIEAGEGLLDDWQQTAEGSLALVILLDQFTRNIFRGTVDAYAGDERALAVTKQALALEYDQALAITGRLFLYHPLHHSEVLAEQNLGVSLLQQLQQEAPQEWRDYLQRSVEGFARHRDVVAQFGRFPHRNRVLGRRNTAAENDYLNAGADHYGQG